MRLTSSPYEPSSLTLPPWVPPPGGLRTWGCGEHFDAVRLPATLAPPLIAALRAAGGHGPVLADPYSGSWHILLDPNTVRSGPWARHGIRLLRPGTRLTIPAAHVTVGTDLHWHTPPGAGYTDAAMLAEALTAPPGGTSSPRRSVRCPQE
ncbi:hypothetical protein ABZZ79_22345 [Streptomyces sp. NPDC006458]|jgi:hypothetical protein|uniref:hypothetical protein n=1 Tax=Streptomyces TaxID=1883 RepID=UPI0004C5B283|nr:MULTISPECIES: hypothetical protein [Streptomyces]MDX3204768.1 hypothetical protein [Streptomyces scabiei]